MCFPWNESSSPPSTFELVFIVVLLTILLPIPSPPNTSAKAKVKSQEGHLRQCFYKQTNIKKHTFILIVLDVPEGITQRQVVLLLRSRKHIILTRASSHLDHDRCRAIATISNPIRSSLMVPVHTSSTGPVNTVSKSVRGGLWEGGLEEVDEG